MNKIYFFIFIISFQVSLWRLTACGKRNEQTRVRSAKNRLSAYNNLPAKDLGARHRQQLTVWTSRGTAGRILSVE